MLQDHMRGRHHISTRNFKALGIWVSLLYIQHDPTPGSTPARLTSRTRALIPSVVNSGRDGQNWRQPIQHKALRPSKVLRALFL
ncbi:hypothetical protein A2U01_0031308 [Trifolium medium]|uniref:Uncharacterized protein n=1 Tax=Trifolium medium TaxID=97028 RepID=A0A392PFX5_9FABA|nr:hypothetical protein [Trifolium medium]